MSAVVSFRRPVPAATEPYLPFRPDVEGLRGVAILLVVACHARVPGLAGGFVGVDVFFTLSGYLITGLLLRERETTGTVDLTGFYARRARRLLPAAALAVLGTLLLSAALDAPRGVAAAAASARAAALFASNVVFAARATDYFHDGPALDPLLHTWSLSVEEQFYLTWPALVALTLAAAGAGRGARGRRSFLVGAQLTLGAASLAACWWYTWASRPTAFFHMPTRAWEFAAGTLVAAAAGGPPNGGGSQARPRVRIACAAAGWAGLVLVLGAAAAYTDRTHFPGVHAAVPVVGTALMLGAGAGTRGAERWTVDRLLAAGPVRWVGRHAYGWYLWHWPLLVLGGALLPSPAPIARGALVLASLGAAALSHRYVEEPVRHAPALARRPRRTVALGLCTAGTVAAVATGIQWVAQRAAAGPTQRAYTAAVKDLPRLYGDGCNPDVDSLVRVCAYGDPGALVAVALFGDSHAAHWTPALERAAARRGWRVLVLTKSACPSVDVGAGADVAAGRAAAHCAGWRRAALDSLRSRRPALVLLANSTEYVHGGPPDGPRPELDAAVPASVSAAAWQRGAERTLAALRAAGLPTVVVHDTPAAPENVPRCLMRAAWRGRDPRGCDFAAAGAVHAGAGRALARAARRFPDVTTADLTSALCPAGRCPAVDGTVVRYRDTRHLTAAGAARLAVPLGDALDRALSAAGGA